VVLVWYGDIIAPIDVPSLVSMHIDKKAHAVVVLADRYKIPVGVAKVDGDRVVSFEEKPWVNLFVSVAVLTLAPRVLEESEKELRKKLRCHEHSNTLDDRQGLWGVRLHSQGAVV